MTPERWREVERIYHEAAAQPAAERQRFLRQVCGHDDDLRRDVEELLNAKTQTGDLLERPAMEAAAPARAEEPQRISPGTRLGPYEILGLLGAGGMGEVYKARDPRLNRIVAIKVLPHCLAGDADRRKSLLREARTASALNHPNIVTVYDIVTEAERDSIVMEYVEGRPLSEIIGRSGLPTPRAVEYAIAIADALAAAHAGGIVHRDIKPGNIMVTSAGTVKVLDFGLARPPRAVGSEGETATMTAQGVVAGTVAYMSPEQAEGRKLDARSDVFSFGACLYEMLSGRRPFARETDLRTLQAIVHETFEPLSEKTPAPLRAVVEKALEKEPASRYQSMAEMIVDLQRWKRYASVPAATSARSGATIRPPRRWRVVAPGAAVIAALFAAGYFRLHGKPKLTDKDTIILADFKNTTGDPIFDGTLRQGLAVELEQSPFLSMISEQRIQQTLTLMGQLPGARLTGDLAQQVCARTASAAVLEGSITPLGSRYVLGLRAERCSTGDVLDEEQAQATSKEDVLNVLSQIAGKFRTRVGESLAMVQEHNTPLAEATTPFIEALKAFSTGTKTLFERGGSDALPYFQRAIQIDPKFAIAYHYVGRIYGDRGESLLSAENTRKAYELRDRASDHEKFLISSAYDSQVTGNIERAAQTFELMEQAYPRDVEAPGPLSGYIYPVLAKYDKTIEQAKLAIALDPHFPYAYINLSAAYHILGRLTEAENTLGLASQRKIEVDELLIERYALSFLEGDNAGMDRAAAQAKGTPVEDWMRDQEASALAYSGLAQQAKRAAREAADLALPAKREAAALYLVGAAVWEALFGDAAEARRGALAALDLSHGRDVEYGAAFAFGLSGNSASAEGLARDLDKRFPEDTSVQFSYLPVLHALFAISRRQPSNAVEALTRARYELGTPGSWFNGNFGSLYPVYVRGLAYLGSGQGPEAAAEFRKMIDYRGINANDPIGALAHLQLGRALALSRDNERAKRAYRDFLALWKDADPDIPILKQAKAEYASLQ